MWAFVREALVGVLATVLYVPLVGYLIFQLRSVEQGIVFSLDLAPQAVTDPQVPAIQWAGVALLGFLYLWALYWRRSVSNSPIVTISAFVSLAALVIVFALVAELPRPDLLGHASSGFYGIVSVALTSSAILSTAGGIAAFEVLQVFNRQPKPHPVRSAEQSGPD